MVSKIMAGLGVALALGLAQPVLAQDAGAGGAMQGGAGGAMQGGAGGAMQGGAGGAMQGGAGGEMQGGAGGAMKGGAGGAMQGGGGSGAAAAAGSSSTTVDLTAEQKTQVIQDFSSVQTSPAQVDFDVSVGVAVPETVTLEPVPTTVVEVVPQYKGFLFFTLADGRIAIVDPDTHKIVAILSA